MNTGNKAKIIWVLFFGLILMSSFLFFHFVKTKKQNVVMQKNSAAAIENNQVLLKKDMPVTNNTNDLEKEIPSDIPILMYHYIRDYSDPADPIGVNLSVSPKIFEEQLTWLQENNYITVFPGFFQNPQALAKKPIILTFDDGYQDAYASAFPLLRKYQMTGMFYLIVGKIGMSGYLTWEEISEMQKAGMVFGSHTLTHPDLRNLAAVNLEKEIKESKKVLEQKLGQTVTDFCYPSGKYNNMVIAEVKRDGYETAVTTDSGISDLKDDLFLLKRLRITGKTNVQTLLSR